MDFDSILPVVLSMWTQAETNVGSTLSTLLKCVEKGLTDDQRAKLQDSFPTILTKAMTSPRVMCNSSLVATTNALVTVYFKSILPEFATQPEEVLDSVVEVFKHKSFFHCDGELGLYKGTFSASYHEELSYLAEKADFLGEQKFFEQVLKVLKTGQPTVSFLKNSLYLLELLNEVFYPFILRDFCTQYRDAVFLAFLELGEEQLKLVTKQDVQLVVRYASTCFKKILEPQSALEIYEANNQNLQISDKFCADFALKCFKSTFLEKRIHGLVYIEEAVRKSPEPGPLLGPIREKISLEWILENRIIETLFDHKNTRDQLISKGKPILKFIVSQQKLSKEMVELMWACSKDKYLAAPTFDLFINQIGSSPHYRELVWHKLTTQLPPAKWTEKIAYSAFRILETPMYPTIEPSQAIEFFESLVYAKQTQAGLKQMMTEKIVSLVSRNEEAKHLFCQKMVSELNTVQNNTNATAQVAMLNGVLRFCMMSKKLYRQFAEETNLLALLSQELCRYIESVSKTLKDEYIAHPEGIMEKASDGAFCYRFSFSQRLDAILATVNLRPKNDRTLPVKQIDLIASHLFDLNLDVPPVKNLAYTWFLNMALPSLQQTHHALRHILPNEISHFFKRWLCCPDYFSDMPIKGIECFQAYFALVNSNSLRVSQDYAHVTNGSNFIALDINYIGIESLFDLILTVVNDDVFIYGRHFFIKLYTKFAEPVRPQLPEFAEQFIDCVSRAIEQALTNLQKGENQTRSIRAITRSMSILKQFLDTTKTRPILEKVSETVVPDSPPMNPTEAENVSQIVEICDVSPEVALSVLQRAHGSLEYAVNQIFNGGPEYVAHIESQVFSAQAKKNTSASIPPEEDTYTPPSQILSNHPTHFNILFRLLEQENINKTAAWEIVNMLPLNKKLHLTFEKLEKPNWEELFDYRSPYKLLYALRLVDTLMAPTGLPHPPLKMQCSEWCHRFYGLGGFAFLYKMILKSELHTCQGQAELKLCLVNILKIVLHFFKNTTVLKGEEASSSPIDLSKLVETLLNQSWRLMQDQANKGSHEEKQANTEAIQIGIELLTESITERPSLIEALYTFKTVPITDFIVFSLIKISQEIRECWFQGFTKIVNISYSKGVESPKDFFLSLLISNYPWNEDISTQYCSLLSVVVSATHSQDAKLTQFVEKLAGLIETSHGDRSDNLEDGDRALQGALNILCAYFQANPTTKDLGKSLLPQVFNICMLSDNEATCNLKCLTKESRKAAFSLLIEMSTGNQSNYKTLMNLLVSRLFAPSEEEQSQISISKSKRGNYVGLLNKGSTCYANSLMQQFFMIPEMRKSIFEFLPKDEPNENKTRNFLLEIQKMFSHLQASNKEFYDTSNFVHQLSDRSFDISAQQDAFEFYNLVTDKLESDLKGTDQEEILNEIFRCEMQRNITCSNGHVTLGLEYYFTLSVEILKLSHLDDALRGFFEGEKIQGFLCSSCSDHVEITKQWSIKTLPKVFIIHLKRFQYDVETATRQKIYDRFVYPADLDMTKYLTKESQETVPERARKYALTGVVVHKGTADAGHYYSFIQDRITRQWYKFDDKSITDFDVKHLDRETFGASADSWNPQPFGDLKNAYILIYEQVGCSGTARVIPEPPTKVVEKIKEENGSALKLRLRCDPNYYDFLKDVTHILDFEPVTDFHPDKEDYAFDFLTKVTKFMFQVSSEANLVPWIESLRGSFRKHIPACKWFLATLIPPYSDWLLQYLIKSQVLKLRQAMGGLISDCIFTLHQHEENFTFTPQPPSPIKFHYQQIRQSQPTVDLLKTILTNIQNHPTEPQYRIVPISSWKNVENISSTISFLICCGFEFEQQLMSSKGQYLWLHCPNTTLFDEAFCLLNSYSNSAIDNLHLLSPQNTSHLMQHNVGHYFLWYLISIIEEARKQFQTFHQYWDVFNKATQISHKTRTFLVKSGLILGIMDQYMGACSPEWQSKESRTALGGANLCHLREMMFTLAHLVRACHNRVTPNGDVPFPSTAYSDCPLLPIDKKGVDYIFSNEPNLAVLDSLFKAAYNPEANQLIFSHLAWEDPSASNTLILASLKTIALLQEHQKPLAIRGAFDVLQSLLELNDSIAKERVATIFTAPEWGIFSLLRRNTKTSLILDTLASWVHLPNVAGYFSLQTVQAKLLSHMDTSRSACQTLSAVFSGEHLCTPTVFPDSFEPKFVEENFSPRAPSPHSQEDASYE